MTPWRRVCEASSRTVLDLLLSLFQFPGGQSDFDNDLAGTYMLSCIPKLDRDPSIRVLACGNPGMRRDAKSIGFHWATLKTARKKSKSTDRMCCS